MLDHSLHAELLHDVHLLTIDASDMVRQE